MKKLKLDLDALVVESYAPTDTPEPRGTVKANVYPYTDERVGSCACEATPTLPMTCAWTCWLWDSCDCW